MATIEPIGDVRTARPENPRYGTPCDIAQLLDGIGRILREEDQALWDNCDLREATDALRSHLSWRLDNYARRQCP